MSARFTSLPGKTTVALACLLVLCTATAVVSGAAAVRTRADRYAFTELGTFHFKQLYCSNVMNHMWFYTFQPSDNYTAIGGQPFDFKEDSNAIGGWRVMAAFAGHDGRTYTREEGFDPCVYANCLGVTCANSTEFLAQGYQDWTLYMLGKTDEFYRFFDYGKGLSFMYPRCGCWDPNFSKAVPRQSYAAFNVDPTGPSAQPSDAACSGLACSENANTNALYYLNATDGTAAGCQCCRKNLSTIVIDPNTIPDCGRIPVIIAPTQEPIEESSEASGSASSPAPVLPATTLYDFVTSACPATTINTISEATIEANANQFCCYLTSKYDSIAISYNCGRDLLNIRGAGSLNCVSTIPNNTFTCCADIVFNGGVSTTGEVCSDALVNNKRGDGARAAASTLLASATALVIGVLAVASGAM